MRDNYPTNRCGARSPRDFSCSLDDGHRTPVHVALHIHTEPTVLECWKAIKHPDVPEGKYCPECGGYNGDHIER